MLRFVKIFSKQSSRLWPSRTTPFSPAAAAYVQNLASRVVSSYAARSDVFRESSETVRVQSGTPSQPQYLRAPTRVVSSAGRRSLSERARTTPSSLKVRGPTTLARADAALSQSTRAEKIRSAGRYAAANAASRADAARFP